MEYKHCAQLDANNIVINVICCKNVAWANSRLGGTWIAVNTSSCGIGWTWDGEQFNPPEFEPPEEPE